MSSVIPARELTKDGAARLSTVAWGPLGFAAALLVLVGLVAMAASVLTDGISGPVVLHHVRQHLTGVGVVVAGFSFVAIRMGLQAEAALVGVLLACALVYPAVLGNVDVVEHVAQPGSERRAVIVQTPGLLDGDLCVVVQSGTTPWSWQEKVLCRSDDDPEDAVVGARWAALNRLRITFGDGSSFDHVVR